MFKKRIVACLVIKDGIVVQSIGFEKYLPIGSPEIAVEFLNQWGIDEIILLDIDASAQGRKPNFALITEISKKNFVPLTVGGGIKSLDDIRMLIHCGADKISINKVALLNPNIIKEASEVFGNQCIVVSIDVKINKDNRYEVFSDSGQTPTGLFVEDWAKEAERLCAGEILLNSIDRDGSRHGYDLNLIRTVSKIVSIPVIACGGVGHPEDFLEGFKKGNASACAAGNFFHFTEHTPIIVKSYLNNHNIDVRLDTYANYKDVSFDKSGRISKRPEHYLEKLRFEYIPQEVI